MIGAIVQGLKARSIILTLGTNHFPQERWEEECARLKTAALFLSCRAVGILGTNHFSQERKAENGLIGAIVQGLKARSIILTLGTNHFSQERREEECARLKTAALQNHNGRVKMLRLIALHPNTQKGIGIHAKH